jgi:hypothetical protein
MISYEYLVVPLFTVEPVSDGLMERDLDSFGEDGWQLVTITSNGRAIFMRPIQ